MDLLHLLVEGGLFAMLWFSERRRASQHAEAIEMLTANGGEARAARRDLGEVLQQLGMREQQ